MVVGYQVLLQVIKQDEVDVIEAHIRNESPQREGEELRHPLAPCRTPRRGKRQGKHNRTEYQHDCHEDALRHKNAVIGHLENQFAHKTDDIVNPFADFGLGGYRRTLGVVVDGTAQVLHVVDELVPPVGILANGCDLLCRGYGILYRPQTVKVLTLLLCHLQLEGGYFLVLGMCHRFGGGFQFLTGHLQSRTNP